MKRPLTVIALAAGLLSMPALAGAIQSNQFEFEVSFDRSALDDRTRLASEYDGIRKQISERCETENEGFNPLRKVLAVRNCTTVAMENTIRKIGHDELTAHHRDVKSS